MLKALRSLKNNHFAAKSYKNSVAPFILFLLTPLEQNLVDSSLHNRSLNFRQKFFSGHLRPKLIKITSLKEMQTLIVEYIVDQFLLTM